MNVERTNSEGGILLRNNQDLFGSQRPDFFPRPEVVIPTAFGVFFTIFCIMVCCRLYWSRKQRLKAWAHQNNAQYTEANNIYPNYHSPQSHVHSPPSVPYPSQQFQEPHPNQHLQPPYPNQKFQEPYPNHQPNAPYPNQQPNAPYPNQQFQLPYPNPQLNGQIDGPNVSQSSMMFPATPPPNYEESTAGDPPPGNSGNHLKSYGAI